MVNLRFTLDAAVASGVIAPRARDALVARAKGLFYPERSYARLLEDGAASGVDPAELRALAAWLPAGQVDVKRADAIAMLGAIRDHLARAPGDSSPRFPFEQTTYWDALRASCDDGPLGVSAEAHPDDVLDELRLDPEVHERMRLRALRRAFGREMDRMLAEELKIDGAYAELRDRAREKSAALEARGLADPGRADAAVDRAELLRWYFGGVVRRPVPENLRGYATANGFADDQRFVRAILREYLFRGLRPSSIDREGGRE
jgi:hypothetical protein